MFKSRNGIIVFVIAAALIAVVVLLLRRSGTGGFLRTRETGLPLDLQRVMPAGWSVMPDKQKQCNFDDDKEPEWLIVYRYDQMPVSPPFAEEKAAADFGPIGAVVLDAQPGLVPEQSGNPSPYQPAALVPYKLLPDFYAGKGQGYLGETGVELLYFPPLKPGAECEAEEIAFLGYSGGELPTRLSLFRWENKTSGYRAAHFVGSARVDAGADPGSSPLISWVTTYNRLQNHRSLLCEVTTYQRDGSLPLGFTSTPASATVDFCFGAPDEPAYPEGVVVALLRGAKPKPQQSDEQAPPTASYLVSSFVGAPGLDLRSQGTIPVTILSLANASGLSPDPGGGSRCTDEQIDAVEAGEWWCGRERAVVETDIQLDGVTRRAVWGLISVTRIQVNADVHWRIERVELK